MTPEELREWMAEHNRSVRGLAAELRVSPSTVARWRDGESAVPHPVVLALEALLVRDVLRCRGRPPSQTNA